MASLKQSIQGCRVKNHEGYHFIPQNTLYDLLDEKALREACKPHLKPGDLDDTVHTILRGAKKVFAILVVIDYIEDLNDLIHTDHFQASPFDHKLPFSIEFLESILPKLHAEEFYKNQWEFCPPFFTDSTIVRHLQPQTVLPYKRDEQFTTGGFGSVWAVEIRDEHHGMGRMGLMESPGILSLVRKEMLPHATEGYETELQNLSLLKLLKHSSIARLLACYTYRQRHNLLFLRSSDGDLGDLLRSSNRPLPFMENESFLIALAGLASAIHKVHVFTANEFDLNLIGCHHDVKPRNVLVDSGRFLLSDFGLSRFQLESDGSMTPYRVRNGYEIPPECHVIPDGEKPVVHRSSDIWSLGCIIAYILAYMRDGADGCQSFKKARGYRVGNEKLFYFHREGRVNENMHQWLQDLGAKCSVAEKMTLQLVREMLAIKPEDRPTASAVTASLQFIALYAMSEVISSRMRFFQATTEQTELELAMEEKRFASWRWSLGVGYDTVNPLSSLMYLAGCMDFDEAISALRIFQGTIDEIDTSSKHIRRHLLLPYRQMNSTLLALLEPSAVAKAKMHLESDILQGANPRLLSHLAQFTNAEDVAKMATTKHMLSLYSNGEITNMGSSSEVPFDMPKIDDWVSINPKTEADRTQHNKHESQLVEWKEYELPTRRELIKPRIQAIVSLLMFLPPVSRFRTLGCIGYCHHPGRGRFGLLYNTPRSPHGDALTMYTLRSILTKPLLKEFPDLRTRLTLAHTLASAVHALHEVSWLHKGLSTSTIVFFHDAKQARVQALSSPYIIGFSHSRPDTTQTFTEGPDLNSRERDYLHPDYLENDEHYEPWFDFYSLGLILFEIGAWKPLHEMVGVEGSQRKIPGRLRPWLPRLRMSAGVEYSKCVAACLDGSFRSGVAIGQDVALESDVSSMKMANRLKFFEMVVQVLDRLSKYDI